MDNAREIIILPFGHLFFPLQQVLEQLALLLPCSQLHTLMTLTHNFEGQTLLFPLLFGSFLQISWFTSASYSFI